MMKKAKKTKTEAKAKKARLGKSAMRDLELMDPGARQVKGGALRRARAARHRARD